MTRKYAMIPICCSYKEDGIHIRRVLIRYLFKTTKDKISTYHFTRIIAVDDYFKKDTSSHQYVFADRYYKLLRVKDNDNAFMYDSAMYQKKKYHSYENTEYKTINAIEFKAKTAYDAIKELKGRNELK